MEEIQTAENSKVYCCHVGVRDDGFGGDCTFALKDFAEGELVERGLIRRINIDGNECPFIFTWSEDRTVWAFGSGCATFYNTGCL